MKRLISMTLSLLLSLSLAITPISLSYAAPVSSDQLLSSQQASVPDLSDIETALQQDELRDQLQAMGVAPSDIEQRLASLTPQERQQLNQRIEELPAGGILGAFALIFVVLVITDALGATDVFTFVDPIN